MLRFGRFVSLTRMRTLICRAKKRGREGIEHWMGLIILVGVWVSRAKATTITHPMEIVMKMITINGNLSENTSCLRHVEKKRFQDSRDRSWGHFAERFHLCFCLCCRCWRWWCATYYLFVTEEKKIIEGAHCLSCYDGIHLVMHFFV